MAEIDETENAECRELSIEETEKASGADFMNPDEWITACIIRMQQCAKGTVFKC